MGLPDSVQEIADVIGRDAALHLIDQLPRCYTGDKRYPNARTERVILYVPKRLKPDHRLVAILGWDNAKRLCGEFGGMILQPANCAGVRKAERNIEIRRLANDNGLSSEEIASKVGLCVQSVKNILKTIPQEEMKAANDNNG